MTPSAAFGRFGRFALKETWSTQPVPVQQAMGTVAPNPSPILSMQLEVRRSSASMTLRTALVSMLVSMAPAAGGGMELGAGRAGMELVAGRAGMVLEAGRAHMALGAGRAQTSMALWVVISSLMSMVPQAG